jgi:hypothetical protein
MQVSYENDALILAESVRVGLVSSSPQPGESLPQQIRRRIDLETSPPDVGFGVYPWGISHIRSTPADVEPFTHGQAVLQAWRLPLFWRVGLPQLPPGRQHPAEAAAQAHGSLEVRAALYLIAKNTEPVWWQLTLRYDQAAKQQLERRLERHLGIEPCFYSRAAVSIRFLDPAAPVEFS